MVTYRGVDVVERCRWQMKRDIRSGRGRNFYTEVLKKIRAPQQDITGLTRKIPAVVTVVTPQTLCSSAFTPRVFALSENCFSQFSRNLGNQALPLQFYMETYRSGHNGADSKSVREQSPASSNLAVSAKDSLKVLSFKEFSLFIPRPSRLPSHLLFCSRYQCDYRCWRS